MPLADGTECVTGEVCAPEGTCLDGVCTGVPIEDGTPCDDLDLCTLTDSCQDGLCTGADPIECHPLDQCHQTGTCDPQTGLCSHPLQEDGFACDDGDGCTQTDTCQAGVCLGADPLECTALDQCHIPGECVPETGQCTHPKKPDDTACDDGDACTQTDACLSGVCVGLDPLVCQPSDQCHQAGVCDPDTGLCSNPEQPDGSACDDGDGCTQTDTCLAGACTGTNPLECTAQDQCHQPGACDPQTGRCSNPEKTDGSACDDGNLCTRTDGCVSGECVGSNPVICPAGNACQQVGACDPATGECPLSQIPDGDPCDDDNLCTLGETCQAGECIPGRAITCDDGDPCTLDGCDPDTGCTFEPTECKSPSPGCGCGLPEAGRDSWPVSLILGLLLIGSLRRRG
jgi:hypothetical protein